MSNFIRFGVSRLLPVPTQSRTSCASRLVLADVVEVVGDDEGQADLRREAEQLLVEPALLRHAVVLELEEEPVLAEDVAVLAGDLAGQFPVLDLERLRGTSPLRQADRPMRPALCWAR